MPFGGAAAIEDDAVELVDVIATVELADFAAAIKDVLVVEGLGAPFPRA